MIFGAKEEIIPKYYDDDKPKSVQKTSFGLVRIILLWLSVEYQRRHLQYQGEKYDEILYPTIEDKPKHYAVIYRNRYMVEKADYIVAYVARDWGGAYTMYQYAKRKGKRIFNLAE